MRMTRRLNRSVPKPCAWVVLAQEHGFTPVAAQPFGGTDLAGTSTAG